MYPRSRPRLMSASTFPCAFAAPFAPPLPVVASRGINFFSFTAFTGFTAFAVFGARPERAVAERRLFFALFFETRRMTRFIAFLFFVIFFAMRFLYVVRFVMRVV